MFNIAPNLLDHDVAATGPNQKCAGDIKCIWTREGWRYLAVILNQHARRVIGWVASNRMNRDPGAENGQCPSILAAGIHLSRSDRGSQYGSQDDRNILRGHGVKASMSGKGNCHDNAAVETFFKTIKAELMWLKSRETRRQAGAVIFQ